MCNPLSSNSRPCSVDLPNSLNRSSHFATSKCDPSASIRNLVVDSPTCSPCESKTSPAPALLDFTDNWEMVLWSTYSHLLTLSASACGHRGCVAQIYSYPVCRACYVNLPPSSVRGILPICKGLRIQPHPRSICLPATAYICLPTCYSASLPIKR
jgi:hypothetical protein